MQQRVMKTQQPDWSGNRRRGERIQVWQTRGAAWLGCLRLGCERESEGKQNWNGGGEGGEVKKGGGRDGIND